MHYRATEYLYNSRSLTTKLLLLFDFIKAKELSLFNDFLITGRKNVGIKWNATGSVPK